MTEVERFYVESHYYFVVSGELDKMVSVHELWKATYSQAVAPHVNQGVVYYLLGQYDKAADEQHEALRLSPERGFNYGNLAGCYLRLDRLQDAEQLLREAQTRKLGGEFLSAVSYDAAFLRGDQDAMQRLVAASIGQGEAEHMLLAQQSEAEAYYGRLKKAREDSRRAQESARRIGNEEAAVVYQIEAAIWETELGNRKRGRKELATLSPSSTSRIITPVVALARARIGDDARARSMAHAFAQRFPNDKLINCYWLPIIEAVVALRRNDPARTLERLQIASPYELADGGVRISSAGYAIYLRGAAYLMAGDAIKAAGEFQRLVDRPGAVGSFLEHF